MKNRIALNIRKVLPFPSRRAIVRLTCWPPVGKVRFGSLSRLKPISPVWGWDRGLPIDRYYIEKFLDKHCQDIKGHVLELSDNTYTLKFGGENVKKSSVLHVAEQKKFVTIIGDLTNAHNIPSDTFDCFILTQTLQVIFDIPTAIKNVYRILKPGGVTLTTVPGISKISRYDMDRWGYYWSFTTLSIRHLFEQEFPSDHIEIKAYGNVLSSISFLHGLATSELNQKELDYIDPDFELLITIRAQKPFVKEKGE
jgi:SAM-dependent methyltransferase